MNVNISDAAAGEDFSRSLLIWPPQVFPTTPQPLGVELQRARGLPCRFVGYLSQHGEVFLIQYVSEAGTDNAFALLRGERVTLRLLGSRERIEAWGVGGEATERFHFGGIFDGCWAAEWKFHLAPPNALLELTVP